MRITKVEIYPISIPYSGGTYQLSQGGTKHGHKVILRMLTDEGIVGLGEAAPGVLPDHTGETQEGIVVAIQKYLGPLCIGEDPFHVEWLVKKLDGPLLGAYGWMRAKCAIDIACWDIIGKALGKPVSELLGGQGRQVMACSRSLPVDKPVKMARRAAELRDLGYEMVTLKIGFDESEDLRRVIEVRSAVGDDFPLEVDPNQAYRADQAIPLLRRMEHYGIENAEQPCPWYDLEGMARVTRAPDMAIIADEMVRSPPDAYNVIRNTAADIICLKLAKMGGFSGCKKIAALCEGANVITTMGSSHTLGVGTAAIHHFWACTPNVEGPVGYGSPMERFADDVILEPIPFENGVKIVADLP